MSVPGELSDAEVFGASSMTQTGPSEFTVTAPREMSDAEVFGAPLPQSTLGQRLGRGLGLGARGVIEGAGQFLDMVGNAGAAVANLPSAVVNDVTGRQVMPEPFTYSPISRLAGQAADAIGLPRPANPTERITDAVVQGGVSMVVPYGAARAIHALPGAAGRIAQAFRSGPAVDLAAGAAGGGAQGVVQEAGGGDTAGMAANFGGSMASAVVLSAIIAAVARRRGMAPEAIRPESITPDEAGMAWSDPDVRRAAEANGMTEDDPRLGMLARRVETRRGAEAERAAVAPSVSQADLRASREAVETGVNPAAVAPPTRQPPPPVVQLPDQSAAIPRIRTADGSMTSEPPLRGTPDPNAVPLDPRRLRSEDDAASEAFRLADAQRQRMTDPGVRDTQPAGAPYGVSDASSARMAQDFADRARSPAGDRTGLPRQTYRFTEPDPNVEFPGAERGTAPDAPPSGRTPLPDQGEAIGPDRVTRPAPPPRTPPTINPEADRIAQQIGRLTARGEPAPGTPAAAQVARLRAALAQIEGPRVAADETPPPDVASGRGQAPDGGGGNRSPLPNPSGADDVAAPPLVEGPRGPDGPPPREPPVRGAGDRPVEVVPDQTVDARPALRALFTEAAAAPPREMRVVEVARVGDDEARRLAIAGVPGDLRGYSHVVDSYAARHIAKEHGSARDALRGQTPVAAADLARIPDIIGSPDVVRPVGRTRIGREGIGYWKQDNGHYFYVEEVRTRARQLAAVTLRKHKGPIPGDIRSAPGRPNGDVSPDSPTSGNALPGAARNVEPERGGGNDTPPPGGTLYANPLADPEAWRRFVAEPMRSAFSGAARTAGAAVRTLTDYAGALVNSSDGQQRIVAARYDSPTFNDVLNKLHATAGEDRGVGRTFSEAVSLRVNTRLSEVEGLTNRIRQDGISPDQVVQAVVFPGRNRDPRVARYADEVRTILRGELRYMRDAGVKVGDQGRTYFPREFDVDAVMRDERGFLARATAEYTRPDGPGLPRAEAEQAAAALLTDIRLGGTPRIGGEAPGFGIGSFTRERSFGPGAEAPDRLGRFYAQQDMESALASYIGRAAKRAEIARRFGDRFSGWEETRVKLLNEGVSGDDITRLQTHIEVATGVNHANMSRDMQNTLGVARTLATMGQLDQSVIINLSEMLMTGVRTGRLDDSLRALGKGLNEWQREIRTLPREGVAELAQSLGIIGGHGHNAIMAARFAAGDPTGRWQERQLAAFFKRIGLEQLTNATRSAATGGGQVFLERLAAGVLGESRLTSPQKARFFLRELGVPDDQAEAFARFVRSLDDQPMGANLRASEMGEVYRTALGRFVDQTVMRPDSTTRPRWAAHPLGAAIFTLNSYAYAFTKNVMLRSLKLAREGATGSGYTPIDRVAFMAPLMMTLPVFAAGQIALQQLRTAVMGDPERERRKTDAARAEDMVKQSGLLGSAQMWFDIASSAAYGKDMATGAAGPVLGLGLSFLDTLGKWTFDNSPRTQTAERNMARDAYRTFVEPGANAALGMMPGGGVAGAAARTAATYAIGARPTQEAFTDAVAGPNDPATQRRQRRTPIRGVTERMIEGR